MQRSLAHVYRAARAMMRFPAILIVAGAAAAQAVPTADVSPMSLQDYAKLPVCKLAPDGVHLAVEPCRTAPARNPMPRRPVPQIVQSQPRLPVPRSVPMPAVPVSPSLPNLLTPPGRPVPVVGCDVGGCYDVNGVRHNNAGSNTSITPSGKLCIRNGVWLQCQ